MTLEDMTKNALQRLCEKEGSVEAVADKAGASADYLKQILAGTRLPSGEPRGVGPGIRRKLEAAFPGWTLPPTQGGGALEVREPGNLYHPLAHDLSQVQSIVLPPKLDWERIMTEPLPPSFTLTLRDDALGDQGAKGHVGEFSTTSGPIEGRGVLFKDRDGNAFVRIYQVRRGTHWLAISKSAAYAPLDSEADGLTVLAVMVGVKWA